MARGKRTKTLTAAVAVLAALVATGILWTASVMAEGPDTDAPARPAGFYAEVGAYQVSYAGDDSPGIPHYAAKFGGSNCSSPHYVGPGGDTATCGSGSGCISAWNWVGDSHNWLLVPKCWLHSDPTCLLFRIDERWTPGYYRATCYIN